jgi:putative transposase
MPRTARASAGGYCYHVINRGNARAAVFHKDEDYAAFLDAMVEAKARLPMRLLAYCLMPNHFHFVMWPIGDGDLGRGMHWLLTTHVRRYLRHYHHSGHIWQGRFKAFPIEADDHLVTVLRYVERNPLRANLVACAEDWPWSSLSSRRVGPGTEAGPVPRCADWTRFVNEPMTDAEVDAIRLSMRGDRPFGGATWTTATAEKLGLGYSLRNRGHQPSSCPVNEA